MSNDYDGYYFRSRMQEARERERDFWRWFVRHLVGGVILGLAMVTLVQIALAIFL
jgi:hypothetical protein